MRILLVEDEKRLSDALAYIFKKQGFTVDVAYDGESGEELGSTGIYDIIILDRMLPGKDGLLVLRQLRRQGITTPVLLLTARDAVADRVEGLDAGADDYLVKPFATDELLARIRALARRPKEGLLESVLQAGTLCLNIQHCEATDGIETIKLTFKEAQLLELFMRNQGQVLTKEQLLNRVWGLDSDVEMNNVEIYIHHLRKKLQPQRFNFCIETVRGMGYCLKEEDHVSQPKA